MITFIQNSSSLNQRIRVVLEVDKRNIVLFIKLRWCRAISLWMLSVFDEQETPIAMNIPVLRGETLPSANLLSHVEYKRCGTAFVFPLVDHPSTDNPGKDNFGIGKEYALAWGDTIAG